MKYYPGHNKRNAITMKGQRFFFVSAPAAILTLINDRFAAGMVAGPRPHRIVCLPDCLRLQFLSNCLVDGPASDDEEEEVRFIGCL
jgi:hypothetical protein